MQGIFDVPLLGNIILGAASFFTPCILPLIPAFIAYSVSQTVDEVKAEQNNKKAPALMPAIFFCMGFGLFYALSRATALPFGMFLSRSSEAVHFTGGLFSLFFGLHLIGLHPIRIVMMALKIDIRKPLRFASAFLIGAGFVSGWMPCVGPNLSSIFSEAMNTGTAWRGFANLLLCSLGLVIPFFLISTGLTAAVRHIKYFRKHIRPVELVCGIIMIIISGVILSGNYLLFASLINTLFDPVFGKA